MVQTGNLFTMRPIQPSQNRSGYRPSHAESCHYRGWVMVERTTGVFMTRDNLHYIRVASGYGERNETVKRFRALVDERDGAANG